MPQQTQEQIERNKQINEINRELKAQQAEERERQKALERQAQKRERSKSKPGDPLVLKIDKWLDRFRP